MSLKTQTRAPLGQNSPSADRPGTFYGSLAVFTAGGLFWAFLPLFIGLQSEALNISKAGAGALGSAYLIAFSLVATTAVLWVPRSNWRHALPAAGVIVVAGFYAVARADSYATVIAACIFIGVGMGIKWAISYRIFGAAANPDRAFGLSIAISYSALAVVVFILGRFVITPYGLGGAALAIIATVALLSLGAFWIPANLAAPAPSPIGGIDGNMPVPVALALAGIFLGGLGIAAIWAFVERIGVAAGFDGARIGPVISGNLLAIGGGSLAAAAISTRIPRRPALAGGYAVLAGSLWTLANIDSFFSYAAAVTAFGLGTGLVLPFQMATLATVDSSGRFVVLIAAAQGFGGALGPLVGGLAADSGGRQALVACGLLIFLASYGMFLSIRSRPVARPVTTE
ncbi:MFS transporter [Exilibacterium tricleocarpae]|uniref:MFS transporter n=1 Tax=Exilibacterium tricleocarpae TaxID=2591008 RepID=A0A545SZZ7_9GAMM|nr:MFS transporter [Exilibacterium tricleocarpae]TQV70509.1 MFS transporter [Exilibacterium tricleocarpae]